MTISRNDLLELFQTRFTCKKYDPNRPVSQEDFETILEVGRLSPSSMGLEPWRFVQIADKQLLEKILPYCWGGQGKFEDASHVLAILGRQGNQMKPDSDYIRHINEDVQGWSQPDMAAREKRMAAFQSNDLQLQTDRDYFEWVSRQCYIAMANMLTAAAALGVDSTPVEGLNYPKVNEILSQAGVFDPSEFSLAVMMCFGHGQGPKRPKTRRDMSEVFSKF